MINYFISKIIVVGLAISDFPERIKYDSNSSVISMKDIFKKGNKSTLTDYTTSSSLPEPSALLAVSSLQPLVSKFSGLGYHPFLVARTLRLWRKTGTAI